MFRDKQATFELHIITFSSLLYAALCSEVGALKVEVDAGVVWDHWIGQGMARTGVSGSMISDVHGPASGREPGQARPKYWLPVRGHNLQPPTPEYSRIRTPNKLRHCETPYVPPHCQ